MHAIELQIFESVAPGGVRRVSWHIADRDRWLSAPAFPGAQVELAESTPGVIWRRTVRLLLPAGARLMRVESSPERTASKDPLAYLWKPRSSTDKRVRRTYFRIGTGGGLERLPAPFR